MVTPPRTMAETFIEAPGVHRPRNVDWKRAAALLYGDWGTSKAYVIGLAFVAAGYASFPLILAVCALTAVVGFNYIIICAHFQDGGGVHSRMSISGVMDREGRAQAQNSHRTQSHWHLVLYGDESREGRLHL